MMCQLARGSNIPRILVRNIKVTKLIIQQDPTETCHQIGCSHCFGEPLGSCLGCLRQQGRVFRVARYRRDLCVVDAFHRCHSGQITLKKWKQLEKSCKGVSFYG
jgi:hypothetical protein